MEGGEEREKEKEKEKEKKIEKKIRKRIILLVYILEISYNYIWFFCRNIFINSCCTTAKVF